MSSCDMFPQCGPHTVFQREKASSSSSGYLLALHLESKAKSYIFTKKQIILK